MNPLILSLILVTGAITSYTDLKHRKIKNAHLAVIFFISLLLYIFLFVFKSPFAAQDLKLSALNMLLAVLVSLFFFGTKRWAGGDAKLFILYSFIISADPRAGFLRLPTLTLFINTFLMGAVILFPIQLAKNGADILTSLFRSDFYRRLARTFLFILSISWILYLFIATLHLNNNVFMTFSLSYLFYAVFYRYFSRAGFLAFLSIVVSGLLLRILLEPASVTPVNILITFKRTFVFSCFFYILDILSCDKTKDRKLEERMPFAPFMFIGAVLSQTVFLTKVMQLFLFLQKL